MADNRKYYYLKLKENFFDSDSIVLLEDMKDGILYSNILLKLYLKSLKNGGRLQLDEHIPYTAQMIATLTRHQIGTVERALAIFQQLGLVEQLDCGLLYMTDIELMIGQSSTEAERKRAARLENKALLPPRTNGGHLSDIRPPEIEIKKEIDIELEKEGELKGQALARSYGRYENVFLTDTELSELQAELPEKWAYYIERLSDYIASTGKKYKNHTATIRRSIVTFITTPPPLTAPGNSEIFGAPASPFGGSLTGCALKTGYPSWRTRSPGARASIGTMESGRKTGKGRFPIRTGCALPLILRWRNAPLIWTNFSI